MRRSLAAVALLVVTSAPALHAERAGQPPNIVLILADDLGYADLGSYGHPTIRTPHLDRMAAEGQRWTDFYAPAAVCSPSRGALLTGRLPVRTGLWGNRSRVLFPEDASGLPATELTLAEALRDAGYATAIVGKWHLGDEPAFLPTRHGFDRWLGIPYSNDMAWTGGQRSPDEWLETLWHPRNEYWDVPLMRGARTAAGHEDAVVEQPAQQATITQRYYDELIAFVRESRDRPFFAYLAHTQPHVPLFRSPPFEGFSRAGIYGDVIEEIDAGVGRLRATLEELDLAESTLVIFTSDNGPWLILRHHAGSAGVLRDGKGTSWEGGFRVPALFWWPGTVVPGVRGEIGTGMDLFTTCLRLAGVALPEDRVLDGLDLSPVLRGEGPGPRDRFFYYRQGELFAYREGEYKIHLITQGAYFGEAPREEHDPPLLFHLGADPGEQWDIADERPEVVERMLAAVAQHRESLEIAPPIFDERFEEAPSAP